MYLCGLSQFLIVSQRRVQLDVSICSDIAHVHRVVINLASSHTVVHITQ